jgi:hypothetical protein
MRCPTALQSTVIGFVLCFRLGETTISGEQRNRFEQVVEDVVQRIESAQFPAHSGIRFPQNGCLSCGHLGLCLGKQDMVGADLSVKWILLPA